jgi:nitric oxide reductase NorE protein
MNNSSELLLPAELAPSAAPTGSDERRLPGDLAIWFFIIAELLVFGVFFVAYAVTRAKYAALFDAEQLTLNRNAGALNTLFLLTASYFVARAVHAARTGLRASIASSLLAAIACGGGFVVVKIFEYADKIEAGITLSSSPFYMFYLSLTFFHFMHVLLGLVILGVLWRQARAGAYGPQSMNGLESGASYWHMVDLVWIVLFPLLYILH